MTGEAGLKAVGDIRRDHIEDFKLRLELYSLLRSSHLW
jgi:hypothetical protein